MRNPASVRRRLHGSRTRRGVLALAAAIVALGLAPYAYSFAASLPIVALVRPSKAIHLKPFTIGRSAVRPMVIGKLRPIDITLINPNSVAMSAVRLHMRIVGVTAPNATASLPCTRADFRLREPVQVLSLVVPARSSMSLVRAHVPTRQWPAVRLIDRPVNQDGCRGATVKLGYTGRAHFAKSGDPS